MAKKTSALSPNDFVHLHNHTQYSLLDGLTKVPELIPQIKDQGMSAVAITDHGTMSGTIEFYKECQKNKIKPIIGIETYVAARKLTDKEANKDKPNFHLTLLAMNNVGYQNLMALSTIANLEGFYYRPRIDHDILSDHNEGIICLSGCASSEIGEFLKQDQVDEAIKTAKWYKKVFGDRYYLELQDHGHPKHTSLWREQEKINKHLLKISNDLDIPAVVTCDAHYLKKTDQDAHEILLCVQTGSFLKDENRMSLADFELYVTDPKDVINRWGETHPDLITNTKKIADRCSLTIELGKILIPKFPVPANETEKSYLEKLVYRGLIKRYTKNDYNSSDKKTLEQSKKLLPKEVLSRAQYELSVINDMKFNGYFLIISDFINWGKDKGIVFGPGRGSAAGSIIAYALRITELDPLEYELLFERFLNPDRISMPDIDIDIQDSRRAEVIEYCIDKYGKDRVANIVTFGRMAARNAIRDVARVLQVPYSEADRLAKMIPPPLQGRHIPLSKSLVDDFELSKEYKNNDDAKSVFDLAIQLEGTIRSHGVHAAGVVIAPEDIVYYTPLELAQKGVIATQYSMWPIEDLGLLKMDFLGLANLTIINSTLRIIKAVHKKTIDIHKVSLKDPKTYELFQKGDTTGVFQFESNGMKRYLKELKPTQFDDLIAMNALYRPGPMQFIDDFIDRKLGRKQIVYEHPGLKTALENTYGILVYQEQFMQISKDMCGFSGGQADTLRKAIGKKQRDTMAKMKSDFIEGMVNESKVTRKFAEDFWARLEAFADYCFNKSHSACYATIAYQTAYLKAHFPAAFMAALMTSDFGDTDRLAIEINECTHMGLTVMPPDINESFIEFSIVPGTNKIRFGMAAIKNVGTGVVEEILEARENNKFTSMEDFLNRASTKVVNKKTMESLIKAGAFDRFNDRSTLLFNLENILAYATRIQKQNISGQTDLFGNTKSISVPQLDLIKPKSEIDLHTQLSWERELLGIYLSQHPLKDYEVYLKEHTLPIKDIKPKLDGQMISIGGIIADKREIITKNGQRMAFVKLEDTNDDIEIVLFPNVYDNSEGQWDRDKVVIINGRVSMKDKTGKITDVPKILVESSEVISQEHLKKYVPSGKEYSSTANTNNINEKQKLYIKLENSEDEDKLLTLRDTLDNYKGQTEVVLVLGKDNNSQSVSLPNGIDKDSVNINNLESIVGKGNLILK
ncbi:MAG TPA: DNA polymerase III subunit alpha [Patescibacteria group bacterium]|nr:DNA polymerase III subunit alpha [Patescibacteria group bacterium]